MKRHSASEVIFAVFVCCVMMIACAVDTFQNAKKSAWGWFSASLVSALFFAAVLGWLLIDAFNRRQRRRREAQKR